MCCNPPDGVVVKSSFQVAMLRVRRLETAAALMQRFESVCAYSGSDLASIGKPSFLVLASRYCLCKGECVMYGSFSETGHHRGSLISKPI